MYEIKFKEKAFRYFNKLNKFDQKKIGKKIEKLKENPQLGIPLIGNLSGLWKLRIGKYRIIYQIRKAELLIFILDIGHRKNIYHK